ncbi:MAG TPA: hypothetical protein VIE65_13910 [Methylobacter sp.]|jgi:O-acetyl-ADP-ribose deacetylase (regulator of RNase III)
MPISYVQGDATLPIGNGEKCIIHIVNDAGRWGRGFVLSLSSRWPRLRSEYINWSLQKDFQLGAVSYSEAEPGIYVAHMIAQQGIRTTGGRPPIRYDSLELCLRRVASMAQSMKWSIHMPRIGCGLAGGKWNVVEPLVISALGFFPITVYDP